MKRLLSILGGLVLANCVYGQAYLIKFKSVNELQGFMQWSPARVPLLSCHRGGPVPGYPENAIETFANSIKFHPTIIECDATLTKDSSLVMMHDDRLDRTTNSSGNVIDKTAAELKSVLLKDDEGTVTPYHIPLLDEVLQWGKDKVLFTLDVKRSVPYRMIVDAVRRNKAEAYSIIITYNANQAAEVHKLAPDLMISASVRSVADLDRLNQMGIPNNRIVAFVGTSAVDKATYDYLHSKGIWCILGTMGNLDNSAKANGDKLYSQVIEDGADILSSDRSMECGKEILNFEQNRHLKSAHIIRSNAAGSK